MQKRHFSMLAAIVIGFTLVLGVQTSDAAVSKKNKNTPAAGLAKKNRNTPAVTVPNNNTGVITPIPEVPAAVPVGAAILLAAGATQLLRRRQSVS